MKSLSENKMVTFNVLSTVIIAGINFFTIPIFTRMLNTDGYGIVNVYVAWVQIATVFVGLKADGSIGSASANIEKDEQDAYQLSCMILGTLSFVILLVLAYVFLEPLSELLKLEPLFVVLILLQSFGTFVTSLFSMRFIFRKQAQKNFIMSTGICVATTTVSILLILFAFPEEISYYGRIYGLSVPYFITGLAFFFYMLMKIRTVKVKYWVFCLTLTLPLVFHGLSQLVLAQTGKIFIQQTIGNSASGVYSIAVTVVALLNSVYSALNNAFVPFMYDDLAAKTSEEIKQKHFRNYFILFTTGTCAFVLMAPEVLKVLSTPDYWEAVNFLPPLIFGQYCVFLYSFPVNFEFFKMKTASIAVGTTAAALVNLGLTVALIQSFGSFGAAFATAISYTLLFLFHFCIARFKLGDKNYNPLYYVGGFALIMVLCLANPFLSSFVILRWAAGILVLLALSFKIIIRRTIF